MKISDGGKFKRSKYALPFVVNVELSGWRSQLDAVNLAFKEEFRIMIVVDETLERHAVQKDAVRGRLEAQKTWIVGSHEDDGIFAVETNLSRYFIDWKNFHVFV